MLYWLLYQVLHEYIPAFRVFGYITTRTALASLTALGLALALGSVDDSESCRTSALGSISAKKGRKSHKKKAGTPTMGGLLIVTSIVVPTLLWADLRNQYVWIAMLGLVAFGAIGFVDDYAKVAKKRNLGLTARQKFWAQVACAMLVGFLLVAPAREPGVFNGDQRSVLQAAQARFADQLVQAETSGRIRSLSFRFTSLLFSSWWARRMP